MYVKIETDIAYPTPFSHSCENCPIRYRAVCAHCEGSALQLLERTKYYRSYKAGQVIVWAGDKMDFVASMVEGMASLTHTLTDGRTQMVGLLLPSDFLGRPGRDIANYTVTAVGDVKLCCFRRKPFEAMMEDNSRIATRLLEMTLDELDAAREWLLLLGRKSAREKIASFLTILARREAALRLKKPGNKMRLNMMLTREAMANYLGLTLETVSRQMSALKRAGLIELTGQRGVTVLDFQQLMIESGDDSDGEIIL